jgi:nickel-dependent lactate racemase
VSQAELVQQIERLAAALPADQLLYEIGPTEAPTARTWQEAVQSALDHPIGAPPIEELAAPGASVVILGDDITRPTPQRQILPPLIERLNAAGVSDGQITVIVALGTHRYMSKAELRRRFGEGICDRIRVINHRWREEETFADLGTTERGTPVVVNRLAAEADLLVGTGSIVPHIYAGWSGGAKIVQPGICSAETTARTHCMAAESDDLLAIPGTVDNAPRREMERVSARVGLDYVLNVVSDARGRPVWAGAGDFVQAHRAGIAAARSAYVRPVPGRAEIAILDATPATIDYWQGVKAPSHAQRAVREGGTIVLVAAFPERIAQTHPEFARYADASHADIVAALREGRIGDMIASATMRLHALVRERCHVICVSPGLTPEDHRALGFEQAVAVGEALDMALARHGDDARVGIVRHGGDLLPEVA